VNKKRLQIYIDAETKRRIELAAAKHNMPITSYCLTAIQQQLEEDGVEVDDQVPTSEQTEFQELIADIQELQERILRRRGGKPIDVDALLDQLREERDEESLGLR
jgi:hypothetical protein